MSQSLKQTQKLSLEQRLAMRLKQELKLKMSLKQTLKLVQKLWPSLNLKLGVKLYGDFKKLLRSDSYLRNNLPYYLERNPTAVELQSKFPQMAAVFNAYYKSQPNYGSNLRQGQIIAPKKSLGLSLSLTTSLKQQQITLKLPQTNWSLVNAWDEEEDTGCKFPKKKLELNNLSLDEILEKVDGENEIFRYEYVEKKNKYFKIPLLRNLNISTEDIAIPITRKEYKKATEILDKAGRVQRIVRAVPYNEIRKTLLNYLNEKDIDLDKVVIIGVDRGGRLPTHIVKNALGLNIAYFLKVDQGDKEIDCDRLDTFIKNHTLRNKHIIFVDSTVDSGRQISALRKYFDDEDLKKSIKHKGWVVVGSNEYGKSLDKHVNIDWGLDPDESFEDNPRLMGVDYGKDYRSVKACGNKMSTYLKGALLEVSKGIILDTSNVEIPHKIIQKKPQKEYTPTLLIIGDGKNVTIEEEKAKKLALGLENKFNVIAGTPNGNPGYVLNIVSQFQNERETTLIQPVYSKSKNESKFEVTYAGNSKDGFRDEMVKKADVVLAIGGNEGTYLEIQKSISQGKPTIVVKNFGSAGERASKELIDSNLKIVDSLEDAVITARSYIN